MANIKGIVNPNTGAFVTPRYYDTDRVFIKKFASEADCDTDTNPRFDNVYVADLNTYLAGSGRADSSVQILVNEKLIAALLDQPDFDGYQPVNY